MKDVIDVSRYQGVIDWAKVQPNVSSAMLKTVSTNSRYGGIYIDQQFERNYSECRRLGIPVGAYYYTYARTLPPFRLSWPNCGRRWPGNSLPCPLRWMWKTTR